MTVIDAIGKTPIVELRRVVPSGSARIVAKLESANPTGSMKDRMALAAINAAEADGRLPPGGTVVEYTGGTTGVSLAFVCAARGYRIRIVFSDAFSAEKGLMMQALGADVSIVPSGGKGISESLIKRMIIEAQELSKQPGHWWSDQLNNRDAIEGYYPLGEEIWDQTGGEVQAFVHAVGTAHSLHGVATVLRVRKPDIYVAAVEPDESAVLSGEESGAHNIEGIGVGFIPPLWEPEKVDEILRVSTAGAKAMARELARQEGIFAGTSSGANIVAALKLAQRLGTGATVATIIVDSGLRYLSTDVYRNA
ncbi:MAG: pyridoxal-phosphate dependent enzyme [Anaerolineales bacterium]|nr:pyridoxal-phosphate dependent enzyme [Anaerolineales bacterium]